LALSHITKYKERKLNRNGINGGAVIRHRQTI